MHLWVRKSLVPLVKARDFGMTVAHENFRN